MASYDEAVRELYQVPLASFVAERKRLAGQLKAAGDKVGAARFAKLARPPMSAWVVNQLYAGARDGFDAMLATAAKLRGGELAAAGAHREALANLRERAAALLEAAGHAVTEATLRRVTQTLSAIAATGGFDPDPPGALTADRDPPGFEAIAALPSPLPRPVPATETEGASKREQERAAAAKLAAEEAERARKAERLRIETALRTARADVAACERELGAAQRKVSDAEVALRKARKIVEELDAVLSSRA